MQEKGAKAQGRRKRGTGGDAALTFWQISSPLSDRGGGRFGQPPTQIFRPFTALGPERHLVSGHIEAVGKLVHSLEAASRPIEN
jgi:hypothetical protein